MKKHRLFTPLLLILTLMFSLTSCGGDDSKEDDPAPTAKTVKVVVTGQRVGPQRVVNGWKSGESIWGATGHVEYETPTQAAGENELFFYEENGIVQTFTFDYPASKNVRKLAIDLYFKKLVNQGDLNGSPNTNITAEIFVDGASVKKVVLDKNTATYSSKEGAHIKTTYEIE